MAIKRQAATNQGAGAHLVPNRITLEELDRVRRYRKQTLRKIAKKSGLKAGGVWRVLHRRCLDLRKIAKVCRAIGVPLHHLDLDSFLDQQSAAPR